MDTCDLCGKVDKLIDAVVEGTMVSVCRDCVKFGHVVPVKKPEIRTEIPTKKITFEEPRVFELIIKDFSKKVKQAREKLDLKQEEVAKRIAEKVSTIQNIESGHLKPSLELAKKLEKLFNISLVGSYEEKEHKKTINFATSSLTIGDLMSLKK